MTRHLHRVFSLQSAVAALALLPLPYPQALPCCCCPIKAVGNRGRQKPRYCYSASQTLDHSYLHHRGKPTTGKCNLHRDWPWPRSRSIRVVLGLFQMLSCPAARNARLDAGPACPYSSAGCCTATAAFHPSSEGNDPCPIPLNTASISSLTTPE